MTRLINSYHLWLIANMSLFRKRNAVLIRTGGDKLMALVVEKQADYFRHPSIRIISVNNKEYSCYSPRVRNAKLVMIIALECYCELSLFFFLLLIIVLFRLIRRASWFCMKFSCPQLIAIWSLCSRAHYKRPYGPLASAHEVLSHTHMDVLLH